MPTQVLETGSALRCWQGYAFAMNGPHRHDDLEVNLVAEAPLTYLFGGTPVEIRPGQIGLFWAAMPHRLIDCPANWRSYVSWLHLPLDLVLQWGLPEDAVSLLLRGVPIISDTGAATNAPADGGLPRQGDFARWAHDLEDGSADLREIALLEIQAAIRRLVHDLRVDRLGPDVRGDLIGQVVATRASSSDVRAEDARATQGRTADDGMPAGREADGGTADGERVGSPGGSAVHRSADRVPDVAPGEPSNASSGRRSRRVPRARTGESTWDERDRLGPTSRADVGEPIRHAAAMARHAAMYFREPIGPSDVAAVVPLHPNYAMTVFRTVVGMTLGEYLTQCRIAEAQRLLITTGATTAEVAAASGFGSQSAFYAAFTKACGLAPGAYRRAYR